MGKETRRSFSAAFKRDAVGMLATGEAKEIAARLGIRVDMLYRWQRELGELPEEAFRGNGKRTALEEENRALRAENARLKEEQEILKKAAAYFAKHQR
jgi:transposase